MTDSPLVCLPFDAGLLDPPPEGLRYETFVPAEGEPPPESIAEVEFYVPPYRFAPLDSEVVASMPQPPGRADA